MTVLDKEDLVEEVLKLDHQLCFRLYAASRNMTRLYTPILEKYHLTYPQYIILLVLFEHSQIDFKQLSNKVDLKTGTMTPIVQKLEDFGYVVKEKNQLDGRKINVILTPKGYALKSEITKVPFALMELLSMDEHQYYELMGQLDQLIEHLNEAQHKTKE